MSAGRWVPYELQQELIRHYIAHGKKLNEPLCIAFGLHPRYGAKAASLNDMLRKPKCKRPKRVKKDDALWARAIERGPVLA